MTRPRPPRPLSLPADRVPRILVVRLSALGDVLHALPAIRALARAWPQAAIDWAVEDRFAVLARARDEVRRVLPFPRGALRRGGAGTSRAVQDFLGDLRRDAYDAVLDLQGNLKSGLVTRLARARWRYGLARPAAREGNHLFSNRRALPEAGQRHRVERALALASALVGRRLPWEDAGLAVDPAAARTASETLERAGLKPNGYVWLQPGTSAFGAFKRWPAACFADLARRLASGGHTVAVGAPPGEEALAAQVATGADAAVKVVPARGLAELGELLRRARLVVAADTGPLHLAALAGTPVLGLFGPKDPSIYGPYGRRADGTVGVQPVLVREDVACRPCRLRACAAPVCMTGLTPDRVAAEAERHLARASSCA